MKEENANELIREFASKMKECNERAQRHALDYIAREDDGYKLLAKECLLKAEIWNEARLLFIKYNTYQD